MNLEGFQFCEWGAVFNHTVGCHLGRDVGDVTQEQKKSHNVTLDSFIASLDVVDVCNGDLKLNKMKKTSEILATKSHL